MDSSTATTARVDNPHNVVIAQGSPTRIRMADGRMFYASWGRDEWRDVRNNRWIDARDLPADATDALVAARDGLPS
jgi:hypothetical protein